VVGWDPDDDARQAAEKAGLSTVEGLADVPSRLEAPRVVLMWAPHVASPRRRAGVERPLWPVGHGPASTWSPYC
jgi:hypothetical protein